MANENENKDAVKVIKVKLSTLVIVLIIFTITIASLIFLGAEYRNVREQLKGQINNTPRVETIIREKE